MFLTCVALLGAAAAVYTVYWLVVHGKYTPTIYWDPAVEATAFKVTFPTYDLPQNVLVTGGCGFLGSNLVDVLLRQGRTVTVFDIRDDAALAARGVRVIKGDLVDKAQVLAALRGQDLVFHCASPPPHLNDARLFHNVNVVGSQNVVDCCVEAGVKRLVFTSSASVVYNGTDQVNVDESIGYPTKYRDVYCATKARAEQVVLEGCKQSGGKVFAIAVRPHGLFGPRDPQLVPTVVQTYKAGKFKNAIGTGKNLVDFTYIGNVVHAHMRAAEACRAGSAANGNAYFITNDEPVSFWCFMSSLLVSLGYTAPRRRLPYKPILALSYLASSVAGLFGKVITFSPSRIQLAGTHHYYNCSKAKQDINYQPLWSVAQGLLLNRIAFSKLANPDVPQLVVRSRPITRAEVAKHNTAEDAWLVMDNNVYDVTEYVDNHPGGPETILRNVGGDSTEGFHGPQHPAHVFDTVRKFQVGRIVEDDA